MKEKLVPEEQDEYLYLFHKYILYGTEYKFCLNDFEDMRKIIKEYEMQTEA